MLLAFGKLPDRRAARPGRPGAAGHAARGDLRGAAGQADAPAPPARRSRACGARPTELLADVGDRARRTEPVAELLRPLAESMRRDWRLSSVRIWTGPPGRLDEGDLECATIVPAPLDGAPPAIPLSAAERGLLARVGVAGPGWLRMWLPRLRAPTPEPPQMRFAPAVDGSRVLGLVVIERAADAAAFTGADERALAAVAGRLAIELRSRALDEALQATLVDLRTSNAELQASRARIVAAATAERRRIERDLHDGAQQHLVALAVGLRLLRDGLPADSPDLELLDELDGGAREAVAELRNLAHGIYPPLLRDAGLAAALRAVAARSPVAVTVGRRHGRNGTSRARRGRGLLLLPRGAAERGEARPRRARHDRARRRRTASSSSTSSTTAPASTRRPPRAARACTNMADRLGAVGGTLLIRSSPGQGTEVSGRVPVAATRTRWPATGAGVGGMRAERRFPRTRAVAWGAVRAVAAAERRTGLRALLLFGALFGLVAGLVLGTVALGARTAGAYPRLTDAVGLDDVRVQVPADQPGLAAAVPTLPDVRTAWMTYGWVARVEGPALRFVSLGAGLDQPPDLVQPGARRRPRPGAGRRRRGHDQRAVGRGERPARRHGGDRPHPHARPDRALRLGRRRPEGPDPAAVGGRDRPDARVGRPAVRGAGEPGVRPALPGHRGEPPRVRPARRHPGRGRPVRPGLRGRGGRGAARRSWPRSCRRGCTARARTATRRRGRPSARSSSA